MNVVALVSYFDEPAEWLVNQIGMLARCNVSAIVHADGAYQHHPTETASHLSSVHTHTQIAAAAHAAGIKHMHITPAEPWESQVAKRNHLVMAGDMLMLGDWLLILDADEIPTRAIDLPATLTDTPAASTAATIRHVTSTSGAPQQTISVARPARLLCNGVGHLHCHGAHYHYSHIDHRGEIVNVTNDALGRSMGERDGVIWHPPIPLEVEHLRYQRSQQRKQHKREFNKRRRALNIEQTPQQVQEQQS